MVNVSRKNYKILYLLRSLSQPKSTVLGQLCLDFCKKLCFGAKLVEKSNFSNFEMISGFCWSIWMDSISTLKIFEIHENYPLNSFQAQEVNRRNPEPGARKLKITNCFVPSQISREGCIWLVRVLHCLISSRDLSQSDLFMTQLKHMLFLKFWVWRIQALPNLVRWIPNSWILFLIPSNMSGNPRKCFFKSRNHCISLIYWISSSIHVHNFEWKTNVLKYNFLKEKRRNI